MILDSTDSIALASNSLNRMIAGNELSAQQPIRRENTGEDVLIAALVTFDVPCGVSLAEMTASFQKSAPKFTGMPGVITKYYLFDGKKIGGAFYLLSSREKAEQLFDDDWRQMLTERYGSPPNLSLFEVPVTVSNAS
jgi:hypothetical protein